MVSDAAGKLHAEAMEHARTSHAMAQSSSQKRFTSESETIQQQLEDDFVDHVDSKAKEASEAIAAATVDGPSIDDILENVVRNLQEASNERIRLFGHPLPYAAPPRLLEAATGFLAANKGASQAWSRPWPEGGQALGQERALWEQGEVSHFATDENPGLVSSLALEYLSLLPEPLLDDRVAVLLETAMRQARALGTKDVIPEVLTRRNCFASMQPGKRATWGLLLKHWAALARVRGGALRQGVALDMAVGVLPALLGKGRLTRHQSQVEEALAVLIEHGGGISDGAQPRSTLSSCPPEGTLTHPRTCQASPRPMPSALCLSAWQGASPRPSSVPPIHLEVRPQQRTSVVLRGAMVHASSRWKDHPPRRRLALQKPSYTPRPSANPSLRPFSFTTPVFRPRSPMQSLRSLPSSSLRHGAEAPTFGHN